MSAATPQPSATPSGKTPGTPLMGILFGFLGVAAFSLTLPMTRLALESFSATTISAGRASVAGLIALSVLAITRSKIPTPKQWARLVVVALGVIVGFPFFTAFAMQYMEASNGAVVIGLLPAATAVAAVIRGRERPSALFWVASIAGALAVIIFAAVVDGLAGGLSLAGILLLGAVVSSAVGYAEGGLLARELGSWQTISWALVVVLPVMLVITPVSLIGFSWQVTPGAWLGFGYAAIFSMYLGFFAWYRGLGIGPIARVSQLQLVQPVLTIVWAVTFFGEIVEPGVWLAAALVIFFAATAVTARVTAPTPTANLSGTKQVPDAPKGS